MLPTPTVSVYHVYIQTLCQCAFQSTHVKELKHHDTTMTTHTHTSPHAQTHQITDSLAHSVTCTFTMTHTFRPKLRHKLTHLSQLHILFTFTAQKRSRILMGIYLFKNKFYRSFSLSFFSKSYWMLLYFKTNNWFCFLALCIWRRLQL